MPIYEYRCNKCGEHFTVTMTILEHDRSKPRCPKCKSTEVEQLLTDVYVQTSKKS
jgi:putative FmdB family regulatory protein